ncbi:MAG TPA: diacylglycerol kinase family protein [Gaiellales bacterium]|jgi:diacylglycerol kinase family enzyme|nr:diacylglycerol kinase family protein [Gaiellales bacterium]
MTRIGVVAHAGKTIEDGLPQLRRTLAEHGVEDPLWAEVDKSRKAPKQVKRQLSEGVDLFFVWGGDGMAQRCVDVLAGTDAAMAVIPAGTANLLATNLGLPMDIEGAVKTGLHGVRRRIDAVNMNGERFAVMAGAGFDANMIRGASGGLKNHVGRASYLWTGAKSFRGPPFSAKITVDGSPWFTGSASCILAGNVGALFAGVQVFKDAEPDDGLIDLAVVTADGIAQWVRTVGRTIAGAPDRSPFFRSTRGRSISVRLDRKVRYELDGGDRSKVKTYDLDVEPGAITICVPADSNGNGAS